MTVDRADGPLPPKALNILEGLRLKLGCFCIMVSVVENIWMFLVCFGGILSCKPGGGVVLVGVG